MIGKEPTFRFSVETNPNQKLTGRGGPDGFRAPRDRYEVRVAPTEHSFMLGITTKPDFSQLTLREELWYMVTEEYATVRSTLEYFKFQVLVYDVTQTLEQWAEPVLDANAQARWLNHLEYMCANPDEYSDEDLFQQILDDGDHALQEITNRDRFRHNSTGYVSNLNNFSEFRCFQAKVQMANWLRKHQSLEAAKIAEARTDPMPAGWSACPDCGSIFRPDNLEDHRTNWCTGKARAK